MPQTGAVTARPRVDDPHRTLRIGQQMVVEGVVHVALAAHQRHLVHAALVEPVIALIAVKSGKQQPAAALAKCQREERLPDELVRDVRGEANVQDAHDDLLAVQIAHVRVPRDRVVTVGRGHLANVRRQVAPFEGLGQGVLEPHSRNQMDRGALLVGQMGAQQHFRGATQRAAHAVNLGKQ